MSEGLGAGATERERSGFGRAWSTLRTPHYTPFFTSNFVQFLCAQALMLAMQWLVMDLTDSRLLIALVAFAQGGAVFLFSPFGGVLSDRYSKRTLMIGGRVLLVALVWSVAWLVASGAVAIAHLVFASLLGGVIMAVIQPATQTFVFDLVGRERLENAVALNATASGVAQVAGPAAGGLLLAAIGVAGTFTLAGSGFLLSAGLLLAIPVAGRAVQAQERRPALRELREGFGWVWNEPPVRLVLLGCTMALFNGAIQPMRPVFARFVLDVGEVGLGGMASASGVGTVLAAFALASLGSFRNVGVWIIGSMFGFALCICLYALAFSYEYVLAVEFLLGVTGQIWNVTVMAGLQLAVPAHMRGRVIGMVFMIAQLGFLAQPIVGALADAFGDQLALGIFGVIPSVVLGSLLVLRMSALRSLGAAPRS